MGTPCFWLWRRFASNGFSRPQDGPKMAQESPKKRPRGPQEGPKSAHKRSKSGPKGPQTACLSLRGDDRN
eukprot:7640798-Pyramimonas_sp.AAC.1